MPVIRDFCEPTTAKAVPSATKRQPGREGRLPLGDASAREAAASVGEASGDRGGQARAELGVERFEAGERLGPLGRVDTQRFTQLGVRDVEAGAIERLQR